jgi:hypothetical protein
LVVLSPSKARNLALAVVVAGFVAPTAAGQLQGNGRIIVALAWIGFGVTLYAGTQVVLGALVHEQI